MIFRTSDLITKLSLVERSEAELRERIAALEACEQDLNQKLAEREQAHAWIQDKLQVEGAGPRLDTGQTTGTSMYPKRSRSRSGRNRTFWPDVDIFLTGS